MRKWRHAVGQAGIDLMDGGPNLHLGFAGDILVVARSRHELGQLIGSVIIQLEQVSLLLNAEKAVVLINETQTPPCLAMDSGLKLTILQRNIGQKWLGCMSKAAGTQLQHIKLEYHYSEPQHFYANLWILLDRSVSISERLKYFNAMVSSVACFHNTHRAIYNFELATLNVQFSENYANQSLDRRQKLIGMRPAPRFFIYGLNGSKIFIANARVNIWSYITCKNYRNLARHVVAWAVHAILRNPTSMRIADCRYANLGSWRAMDDVVWNNSHVFCFFFLAPFPAVILSPRLFSI